MKTIYEMFFSVAGANSYESDTPSCAYVERTSNADEAKGMWLKACEYPVNQFMLVTVYTDGTRSSMDLDER